MMMVFWGGNRYHLRGSAFFVSFFFVGAVVGWQVIFQSKLHAHLRGECAHWLANAHLIETFRYIIMCVNVVLCCNMYVLFCSAIIKLLV